MQCLCNYKWVKLPRNLLPQGMGIMGDWAKLAARAAFRRGNLKYCGFSNPVAPGMWAGGIVGEKAILGVRSSLFALLIAYARPIFLLVLTIARVPYSRRIQASELLPGDLGFLLNSEGSDWMHVLIFAGYDETGQRLWVHCTAGSGVILNTPSYEGRLIQRRPTVAVLG